MMWTQSFVAVNVAVIFLVFAPPPKPPSAPALQSDVIVTASSPYFLHIDNGCKCFNHCADNDASITGHLPQIAHKVRSCFLYQYFIHHTDIRTHISSDFSATEERHTGKTWRKGNGHDWFTHTDHLLPQTLPPYSWIIMWTTTLQIKLWANGLDLSMCELHRGDEVDEDNVLSLTRPSTHTHQQMFSGSNSPWLSTVGTYWSAVGS